ncbi:cytochrome b-c1 complex subunit 7 [Copidosoma floridanum]|uniref:cytochrome b-c1 complex subunit 7 n=1 Tax=Copidosoma floridanum TaxID=29053 RepID=UPI0006C9C4FE|nr:cytochrome b-c1 complex subunit 7 [Copidosoma floridanum]
MMRRAFMQVARQFSERPNIIDQPPNKLIGPNFQQWFYNKSGFNQYGLMRDDCIHETEVVKEALRRLPQHLQDERVFRIVRAGYLSLRNDILPKEQWTKLEEDVKYLQPYIDEVEAEIAEKKRWEASD